MKIATIILSIIAIGLIIFNLTQIDWIAPFAGDSVVAIITILASLCAVILLQILRASKKIETLSKRKRRIG